MVTVVVTMVVMAGVVTAAPTPAAALTLGSTDRNAAAPSPSPQADSAEQAMAVATRYEDAFARADCDGFVAVTTKAYRAERGLADCDTFVKSARGRAQVLKSVEVTPMSASSTGRGTMTTLVRVRMDSLVDDRGRTVTTPVRLVKDYRYDLLRADGTWKLTQVYDVTGGRTEGQVTVQEQKDVDRMMAQWSKAFATGDCAAFRASTTTGFQRRNGWSTCAAWRQFVDAHNRVCPRSVHQEDIRFHDLIDSYVGEIMLDVVEDCTVDVDGSGNPIDPPYVFGTPYRFHLVHDGGGWKIDDGDDGAAAEDEPANANERAAVAAMRAYNKAWADADCDAYLATTSGAFRESLSLSSCSAFIPAAKDSHEFTNFTLTPTDIERPSSTRMEIKSHEIFDATTDPQGRPLDKPIPIDRYYLYTLDLVDGSWVISSNPPLR